MKQQPVLPKMSKVATAVAMSLGSVHPVFGAVTTCVDTATKLRSALYTAGNNSQDDVIQLVQGTFTGNFTYTSTQAFSITLQGGYGGDCASRGVDATNTILDGNQAAMALAIASSGGGVTVEGVTFRNGNRTTGAGGGGLYVSMGSQATAAILQKNRFENNTTSIQGGGLYVLGNVTLTGNTFSGNKAPSNEGGGAYVTGNATLTSNTLTGNTAYSYGGGAKIAGNATLTSNTITSNEATWSHGGGVYVQGNATLNNNTVRANKGYYNGGIYVQGTGTLTGNTISNNTANCDNAGIYIAGVANLTNNTVSGNAGSNLYSGYSSGAYFAGEATLNGNLFSGNTTPGKGGGAYFSNVATLTKNTFTGNTATQDGGGIYISGGQTHVLTNNVFSGNKVTGDYKGGGAYIDGPVTLINNSFNANIAAKGGGVGLVLPADENTSHLLVANNIFWGNVAPDGADLWINNDANNDFFFTPLTMLVNNFDQIYPTGFDSALPFDIDPNNLDKVDPLFVDAATHNLHLTATSPMIDAGDQTVEGLPDKDFDGGPRVNGSEVDIGADEFGSNPPPVPPIATTTAATNIQAYSATLNGTVNDNGGVTTVSFEFGLTTGYGTSVTATPASIPAGTGNKAVTANKTGLICNTNYNYRVKATNSGGTKTGLNQTFKTGICPIVAPVVTSNAATAITANSATLNGTVISSAAATASFQLGLTDTYGTSVTATPAQIVSATPVTITGNAVDLACATPYYFRATAVNSAGTGNGSPQTFTTAECTIILPTVATNAATGITEKSATLNGQVNGNGTVTTVTFDLGTSIAYGIEVPATPTGFSIDSPVTATKTGLSCATTYHYRVKAVNNAGTKYGDDKTFATGLLCSTTPTARLSPPAPIAKIGTEFNLEMLVNTNGLKVGGYDFTVNFDQTKVVVNTLYQNANNQCVQGVCPGADMPIPNVTTDNDNGIIQVAGLSPTGVGPSNDLALVAIRFKARNAAGPTPVSLTLNDLVTSTQPVATIGDGSAKGATINVINYECGDSDGNGFVNIVDALAISRKLVNLPAPPTVGPAADVDGDGLIKITDAMNIARYSVGLLVINTCFVQ